MIKNEGSEAQQEALDWGYNVLHIDQVVKTIKAEFSGCRFIYVKDGRGRCQECGNWDYSGVPRQYDLEVDASTPAESARIAFGSRSYGAAEKAD